jgi:hypothetical protein
VPSPLAPPTGPVARPTAPGAVPSRPASRPAAPGPTAPPAAPGPTAPGPTAPPAAPGPTAPRPTAPGPTARTHPTSASPPPATSRRPVATPRLPTSSDHLLTLARAGLAEATAASSPPERYAAAHLSALRAAAAVIGARARPAPPGTRRTRPLSAWVLLATVAPELGEWAAFFAAGARKRAAADACLPGSVTAREADDLLRDAETFLAVAETKLGAQPLLYRGVG